MHGASSYDAIYFEDDPLGPAESPPVLRFKTVTGGYFETMRQALVAGRLITRADVDDRLAVAMVSRRLATERWGSAEAAIGQRIAWGVADGPVWSEIIGVVQDEHDDGVDQPAPGVTYWPVATINPRFPESIFVRRVMSFAVRTTRASPTSLAGDVRQVVASINTNLAVSGVGTLQDILDRSMARTSFTMVLLLISATAALALGLVGIYGVVSYVVSLRTREIGVRIALGADARSVSRMVLRQGAALSLAGVAVGLAAAAGLTRLMSSLLFGVGPTDPLTFGLVAIGLVGISLVASYLPARRVSRTDPVVALRSE
jgi:predicted permease